MVLCIDPRQISVTLPAIACKVTVLLIKLTNMKKEPDGSLKFKMGPIMQKALLLIEGGLVLGLTTRPDI